MSSVEDVVPAPDGQLSIGLYSYARMVGDFIFVAGHTALARDGSVLYPGDPLAQMRHTLEAINDTLKAYGATINDMVQIRWYLTDVRYREAILLIRKEYFTPPYPTSTLLGVSALALEGLTVEVDGVAVRPSRG